ncbi:MAG TPA: hypothetical protein VFU36_16895 [Jatrophihabitans sp.]|nr:hypothetical protein [Jatrophihabitans sp.]
MRAQLAARRWQLCGNAVVLHNGVLSRRQGWDAALINTGPRAILTGFTAAEYLGLTGWQRDWIDVLAPAGAALPIVGELLRIRLHRSRLHRVSPAMAAFRCHALPGSLVVAARSFISSRPACGMFAAAVQQRLTTPSALLAAVETAQCTRHRRALRAALQDIAGGSQALSEIDFVRLCRRYQLPIPVRQAVRTDRDGKRRFLDASWRRADGRLVVVEVDGALHLTVSSWWADQERQNWLAIGDALVLRFPSWAVRHDEYTVVQQLRVALQLQPPCVLAARRPNDARA